MRISITHNDTNDETSFDIKLGVVILGRETTSFIQRLDKKNVVSRRHLKIMDVGCGDVIVHDLDSSNGTKIGKYLNAPYSKMAKIDILKSGVRVRVADLSAIYIPGFTIIVK